MNEKIKKTLTSVKFIVIASIVVVAIVALVLCLTLGNKVEKTTPTVSVTAISNLTYNNANQDLVSGSTDYGTLKYAIGENATTAPDASAFSTAISQATNVGTYYVWYMVVGDEKVNDVSATCVTVEIAKATPTVSVTAISNLTYSDSNQDLVSGSTDYGTLKYAIGENATTAPDASAFGTAISQAKNVSTYYVWYMVVGGANVNDVSATCVTVQMAKATPVVSDIYANEIDEGSTENLVTDGSITFGTLQYALTYDTDEPNDNQYSTAIPTANGLCAGVYYVWYRVVGDSNVNDYNEYDCVTVYINSYD